jgi:NAD(P)-dependent dehydrogenase (short-subunit alcohol dehydrogenase family)
MLSFFGSGFAPAYSASKGGVAQLTKSLAIAWASEGIRVNAIAPGGTLTDMIRTWAAHSPGLLDRLRAQTPLRRMADPDEIAQAAAWLLSDRSSFVTGTILRVDGGARA